MERLWTNFNSLLGGGFSPNSSPSSSPSHSASTSLSSSSSLSSASTSSSSSIPEETKKSQNNNECLDEPAAMSGGGDGLGSGAITTSTAQTVDAVNQNAPIITARKVVPSAETGQAREKVENILHAASPSSGDTLANASIIASSAPTSLSDRAKDVEFMNEQNLARSRGLKPSQVCSCVQMLNLARSLLFRTNQN